MLGCHESKSATAPSMSAPPRDFFGALKAKSRPSHIRLHSRHGMQHMRMSVALGTRNTFWGNHQLVTADLYLSTLLVVFAMLGPVSSCVVRNATGDECCVSVFSSGSAEAPKKHVMKPDDETSCSADSKFSHITAWYLSQTPPNTHGFQTNPAIVELTPSLTSSVSVGTAGADETKQKLTFVNQCSVDIWFRLFFNDDYKDRLVFAGGSEAYEFDDERVTSFGAKFQYPPKNGVSDYRWNPAHEANVAGSEVTVTFKPTIAFNVTENTSCSDEKASKCAVRVRNATGDECCVSVFSSGSAEAPKKHVMKPDDETSCSADSKFSHITAWYLSQTPPNTHGFQTNPAIVELTPSLTSSVSVGTAGADETKQKLTFVNQCSVDIWFRLFFNDDYKDRLVFAGGSEAYEFDDERVTSFGAKFQYPPKNGVSDYRWNPAHEANVAGSEVTVTFKPTITFNVTEKQSERAEQMGHTKLVQDLFKKYDPRRCLH